MREPIRKERGNGVGCWAQCGTAATTATSTCIMALIGFIEFKQNKIIAYAEAKSCVDFKRSTAMSAKHKSLINGSVKVDGL